MLSRFRCVRLFATLWTVAWQAPLSMGFSRQEYREWVGIAYGRRSSQPSIKPESPTAPELQADFLPLSHPGSRLGQNLVATIFTGLCVNTQSFLSTWFIVAVSDIDKKI